jgi:multidrug efflux pump subunit AcrB
MTAIVLSGVVALTPTPALCAMMLNTHGTPRKKTHQNPLMASIIGLMAYLININLLGLIKPKSDYLRYVNFFVLVHIF